MVVDQPATIGALAVAVAQDMGITVGYLPGLSMRRIADLTPGSAKTDAKDAAVIAGAARTMPHTLRAINASDEEAAALSMLTGFDLDLARQVNQTANRIRGLYTQIHPALEAVVGPWLEHDAVLEVIAAWPTPADLKRAGKARIDARLKKHGCRRHTTWAGQIVSALEHQTVVVAGTDAAAVVLVKPWVLWRLVYLVPVVAGCDCFWLFWLTSGIQAALCSAGGGRMPMAECGRMVPVPVHPLGGGDHGRRRCPARVPGYGSARPCTAS